LNSFQRTFGFINNHPLAKRHLFKAYFNFFKWQFRAAFNKNLIISPFIHDIKIATKKGMYGITGNLYAGLHEFHEMGFLLHFLQQSDIFFDVGANAGSYTLLAAGVKNARCYSFEPVPSTFEILRENLRINQLEHLVKAVNAAAGNENDFLNFSTDYDATNHVLNTSEKTNTIRVDVVKLDNFATEAQPSIIKIDVEGYETAVIQGAANVLQNPALKAIIIELIGSGNRYGFDEMKIHQQLLASGFQPYAYDPFTRKLSLLESFAGDNTIYIRDIDEVKNRVLNAPAFNIFGEAI
jgi:FkbM family methyltransferase